MKPILLVNYRNHRALYFILNLLKTLCSLTDYLNKSFVSVLLSHLTTRSNRDETPHLFSKTKPEPLWKKQSVVQVQDSGFIERNRSLRDRRIKFYPRYNLAKSHLDLQTKCFANINIPISTQFGWFITFRDIDFEILRYVSFRFPMVIQFMY